MHKQILIKGGYMFSGTGSRLRDGIGLSVVLFVLASCGGGGGGGSSGPAGSKLFVVDAGNHAIATMINPTPTTTVTIDRLIAGTNTGLGTLVGTPSVFSIPSIVLDAPNDRLYVAMENSGVVTFNNASVADGNINFTRRISGAIPLGGGGTLTVNFSWIDVDKTRDVLYSVAPGGEVHIYNGISTLSGFNLAPNRTITPDFGGAGTGSLFGIAIDVAKDLLYVGLQIGSSMSIAVFNNASTASTTTTSLAPTKTITFPLAIGSIYLDAAHDRMYLSQFDGKVLVYDNFSNLGSGAAPTANRMINISGGTVVQFYIFADASRDKLYAVGNIPGSNPTLDQGFLIIVNNASTADDTGGPTSTGVLVAFNVSNIRLSAVAVKP